MHFQRLSCSAKNSMQPKRNLMDGFRRPESPCDFKKTASSYFNETPKLSGNGEKSGKACGGMASNG
jgi:hypothetical protein